MGKQIRVLHITEMLSAAGIESFIMNVYRNIDRNKVQFDFLVLRDEKEFYDDEIASLGGRKYFVHSDKKNTLIRVLEESRQLEAFLQEHHYDIVHIHYTTPLRAFYLVAAKKAGVSTRIYHSHSAEVSGKSKIKLAIYSYCKRIIDKYATHCFSCSEAAAKWIFSDKALKDGQVKVIHNGIDTNRFKFDENIRKTVRNELGIDKDTFVLINTGRFTEQKNQSFILDIVAEMNKKIKVNLLLLGDGPLKRQCQDKAKKLEIDRIVKFLGVKSNVQDYLFAADYYVMPSLYEGLPVAGIEAECTGIPCAFSDNITREVAIGENTIFFDLQKKADEWGRQILETQGYREENAVKNVKAAGYDIKDVALWLQDYYMT